MSPQNLHDENQISQNKDEGSFYSSLCELLRIQLKDEGFPAQPSIFDCGLFHGHLDYRKLFFEPVGPVPALVPKVEGEELEEQDEEAEIDNDDSRELLLESETNTGEEQRTAALMGLISAHLSWYNLIGEMCGEKLATEFRWGATTRNQEARNGADFGVVIELPDGTASHSESVKGITEKLYNVAYFQAKLEAVPDSPNKVEIKIAQPPTRYYKDAKRRKSADSLLKKWVNGADLEKTTDAQSQHQIVKLALSDATLRELDKDVERKKLGTQHSYVHYVAWRRKDENSIVASLEEVRKSCLGKHAEKANAHRDHALKVKEAMRAGKKMKSSPPLVFSALPFTFQQCKRSFAEFISSGQTQRSLGWATIGKEKLEEVIKNWPVLGARWMIVETRGGGLCNLLNIKDAKSPTPAEQPTAAKKLQAKNIARTILGSRKS